jgi:hypothetical protein
VLAASFLFDYCKRSFFELKFTFQNRVCHTKQIIDFRKKFIPKTAPPEKRRTAQVFKKTDALMNIF